MAAHGFFSCWLGISLYIFFFFIRLFFFSLLLWVLHACHVWSTIVPGPRASLVDRCHVTPNRFCHEFGRTRQRGQKITRRPITDEPWPLARQPLRGPSITSKGHNNNFPFLVTSRLVTPRAGGHGYDRVVVVAYVTTTTALKTIPQPAGYHLHYDDGSLWLVCLLRVVISFLITGVSVIDSFTAMLNTQYTRSSVVVVQ